MDLFGFPFFFRRRRDDRLRLEVIEPPRRRFTRAQILVIPLAGLVNVGTADSLMGRTGMLVTLKDRLRAAARNPNIKAVILRVDSPGGEITASDLILRELLEFKRQRKIPVIAWMGTLAASGGLYISMAADEIYAQPTTITGSIGVIAMFPGLTGLGEKLGIEMRIIKSGANKDLGQPWRPMSDEQRKILEDLINGFNVRFREVVTQSRQAKGLAMDKFNELADGRILDAVTAWSMHLIDGIKYPDEIIARAREVACLDDARLVSYEYGRRVRGNIYAQTPAAIPFGTAATPYSAMPTLAGLLNPEFGTWTSDPATPRPVFMYLWLP